METSYVQGDNDIYFSAIRAFTKLFFTNIRLKGHKFKTILSCYYSNHFNFKTNIFDIIT